MPAINIGMPSSANSLYWDPEANDGQGGRITTHSMVKTMRRCPKQAEYKYYHRLKPKRLGSPLKRGVWVHSLLEAYHKGDDWVEVHKRYSHEFNQLFDEEKDYYGDMPNDIGRMMRAYIWHYRDDPWEWIDTEFQLEAKLPDGTIARGKLDALIRDSFGNLWLVDNKTHKSLPDHNFRLLDAQSASYVWLAQENGIEVKGFIWNYLRWKPPTVPKLLKDGTRISDTALDTDYPTFVRALKKYKAENPQFVIRDKDRELAKYLRSQRFQHGEMQRSGFFRRDVLERDQDMIERVMQAYYTTSQRLHSYDFSDSIRVERVPERSCSFGCNYVDICTAELLVGDSRHLRKSNYRVGDPNDYYNDRAGDYEREERA